MLLAPTHPIAVYGYLAARYLPDLVPEVWARTQSGLAEFLISPEQVARYRLGLRDDLLDTRGGRLFAIVRLPDGSLAHAPIRTWNAFLPPSMPVSVNQRLDRKEFPFLGDAVELWLQGKTIVAVGHYHPFGGGPSPGDIRAQQFSSMPEVVVSNGVVPVVYLRGTLLPYGANVEISEGLFRSLRTLEWSLNLKLCGAPAIPSELTVELISFLAYLRDYRDVDLNDTEAVRSGIGALCEELVDQCMPAFDRGFLQRAYHDNPDLSHLIRCLQNVQLWVSGTRDRESVVGRPPRPAAEGAADRPARVLLLSGQNNHAWQETTPVLKEILEHAGFAVDVTDRPEAMTVISVAGYDVIASNWNAWGDAPVQTWPDSARMALMAFVRSGHGFVSVHAGSSSFYDWEDYQDLAITAWDLKTTGHGKRHGFAVTPSAADHPITQGMAPFEIFDELWHGVPVNPDAQVLATAYSSTEFNGTGRDEPVLFARSFESGRSVNLLLGHDVRAMRHAGFATLLARSVAWAATGAVPEHLRVGVPVPGEVATPGNVPRGGAVAYSGALGPVPDAGQFCLARITGAGRPRLYEAIIVRDY